MPKAIRSASSSGFFSWALGAARGNDSMGRRSPWVRFAAATVTQAAAHGVLATSAGLLGQALVRRQLGAAGTFVDSLRLDFPPLLLCAAGFAAAVVKAAAGAVVMYEQKRAAFRAGDLARRAITDAILQAGQASGSASEAHAAMAIRLRDVERGVDEGVLAAIRAAAHILPLAVALIVLSSRLALVSFAVLLPFALVLGVARKRLRAASTSAGRLAEQLHAGVDELVRHLDLWRTFGAGARIRGAVAVAGAEAGRASARADAARAAISGGNEVLAALALLVAVALVERGALALDRGPLVAFAAIFFLTYRPLRDLGDARVAVERGAVALADLERLRADAERGTDVHRSVSTVGTAGWTLAPLVVQDLTVAHDDHETAAVTLETSPGEIVALIGPTGVGKTSFLRALLGLTPATRGKVRYGDRDLMSAGVGPSERPFAWVPQEPAIVAATLGDNIALGAPAGTDAREAARDALRAIGADSLIPRIDELLAAGGPEMSGGERQWVAIARAIASGLPVLLLDEPTAGLDADSQQRVLDALLALRGKRTVILVTHRAEPLAIADRVVRV